MITVKSVDWDPLPQRGKSTKYTFKAASSQKLFSGDYSVEVTAYGFNLPKQTGDMCDPKGVVAIPCPLEPTDELTLTGKFDVPWYAPNGQYSIKMAAEDHNKKELLCVEIAFPLGGSVMTSYLRKEGASSINNNMLEKE